MSLFTGLPRRQGADRARRPGAAHLHQEHLHGEPVELLHLLRHREVRRVGAGFAAHAVPVPRRFGGRHPARRRRSATVSGRSRDLVLDPRRAAVHAGAALRQPVLGERAGRPDRPDHLVGLLGHRRHGAGTRAWPGRHDRRHLLRLRLRHGRPCRGRARRRRRLQGHRVRLQDLLVPAAARHSDDLPAGHE